jgi:hypothetical protein
MIPSCPDRHLAYHRKGRGSGAILLDEGRIDSIIQLNVEEIDQQLGYFATLLELGL